MAVLPDGLASQVAAWQAQHGRQTLPWQTGHNAYRIWVSEIMLQQTQVSTAIPYYTRFIARFPDVQALARADSDTLMRYWAGLGYYARARNLHACARLIVESHGGAFPDNATALARLPGIGRSTAAAIAALAYGERAAIMDGNARRVFARYFAVRGPASHEPARSRLWALAEEALASAPATLDMRRYTQGLMDLGALVCTRHRPDCAHCPLQAGCQAYRLGLQEALPEGRPRKPLPERHCIVLALQHRQHLLLERRPARGIWGGLWCLPQFQDEAALALALAGRGASGGRRAAGPALSHRFTHFQLHIRLEHVQLPDAPASARPPAGPDEQWVHKDALNSKALPAPIQTLLGQAFDSA